MDEQDTYQLNREIETPLWMQLKAILLYLIESNSLPPGTRIPSEHELCRLYGVSRTVVREALNELVHDRYLYKIQGKGAFVSQGKDEQNYAGSNIGFSGEMMEKGRNVTTRIISQECCPPNRREKLLLRLEEGVDVIRIVRLMFVEEEARLLVYMAFPSDLVSGLENANLANRSMYDVLKRRYGLAPHWSERWIEAILPTDKQAELFEMTAKAPLLGVESLAYLRDGRPFEYYYAIHRSDLSRLHFTLR